MNPSAESDEAAYTLDVIAELTGLSSQTVLRYHEEGLITSLPGSPPGDSRFDDETVRTLRRIEHFRSACEMNTAGLKLLLALTNEIERLEEELRRRR